MARIPTTSSRVVIESISPQVDCGRFPVKRVVGDVIVVEADVFSDGHDVVRSLLRYHRVGSRSWHESEMEELGNDRWRGSFLLDEIGNWGFEIEGWVDHFATWVDGLRKKVDANLDVTVDLLIGAGLVSSAVDRAKGKSAKDLKRNAAALADDEAPVDDRIDLAFSSELGHLMTTHPDRTSATRSQPELGVSVDRERARFSTWYELFPRSWSGTGEHGSFSDVERNLDYVAAMGFDVLYLPPIHPIGTTHRKGPNNTLKPGKKDPGVPWAIGSAEGGHTEILSDLGTIDDFRSLRDAASSHGLEIALDVAFQCSPDHPWVQEHPEWFRHRPDGSVQYAENPPKKYEDIYPIDFETDDAQGLWKALKGVFDHWIDEEIRIFRVDNPHTKAFPFWEWVIGEIKSKHPDVIFLAEAFTRPKVMYRLAKLGFTQSYTYFAWRNTRHEIMEYMGDLTRVAEFFRPNFWPNTPDILTEPLQTGGRPVFMTRYVLAATLSPSCGIYGPAYELMEHTPLKAGSEEYRDSEKYEIRTWDLDRPDSLSRLITQVNKARNTHPALQRAENLTFHPADNDMIISYSKRHDDDVVLVVVNLDPNYQQSGWIYLNTEALGLEKGQHFQVHDLLTDRRYLWEGERAFVQLDPTGVPAHVFSVRTRMRTERSFDYFA
ncbi:MAG: alpha-1,4-glucan--maltose-1-phosphate maltosyltransferase [Acidimicrobiia bacterium]